MGVFIQILIFIQYFYLHFLILPHSIFFQILKILDCYLNILSQIRLTAILIGYLNTGIDA